MQSLVFGSHLPISIQVILLLMTFFFKVNHMLGGRLYLANKSLNLYGFGLLGRPVEWYGNGLTVEGVRNYQTYYLYVDNLYVQVLQRFGLLILGLMLSVLTLTLSKIIKKRQWVLALILILMSFHSMIDDLNFYLHNNIFLDLGRCFNLPGLSVF